MPLTFKEPELWAQMTIFLSFYVSPMQKASRAALRLCSPGVDTLYGHHLPLSIDRICDFFLNNWVWRRWRSLADVTKVSSQKGISTKEIILWGLVTWELIKDEPGLPQAKDPPCWLAEGRRSLWGGISGPPGPGGPPTTTSKKLGTPVLEQPRNEFHQQREWTWKCISPQVIVHKTTWSSQQVYQNLVRPQAEDTVPGDSWPIKCVVLSH